MTVTPDLGQLHRRLTMHQRDIDKLRDGVARTMELLAGKTVDGWSYGQIVELWAETIHLPWAQTILVHLANQPDVWIAFVDIVPAPERRQARNELGSFGRHQRSLRADDAPPLYSRAQRPGDGKQAYRMSTPIAAIICRIIEETP